MIEDALDAAIAEIAQASNEPFPFELQLITYTDPELWAMVRPEENGYAIHCNTGTEQSIQKLWSDVLIHDVLKGADGAYVAPLQVDDAPKTLAQVSLTWLMMHELMHIAMGHFDLIVEAEIVGLSSSRSTPSPHTDLAAQLGCDPVLIRHCLEMQADWQAGQLVLDAAKANNFTALRIRAVSIMAVVLLIERGNMQAGTLGRDHPSAMARFFTLMAGLFQRWMYERGNIKSDAETARVELSETPTEEELKAYFDGLVRPVVNDVIVIATALELTDLIADLRGDAALIRDIFTAQYGEDLSEDSFGSKGGKEWSRLIVLNEQIMQASGMRSEDQD